VDHPLTAREEKQIALLMKKAEHHLKAEDAEAAVEQWVEVLHIQADHEDAMRLAVAQLARMGYMDDAEELVNRAIKAGTQHPSIYLTAIDIARRQNEHAQVDALSEDLVRLPGIDDSVIVRVAEGFIAREEALRARDLLTEGLQTHPDSPPILTALGELHELMGEEIEARRYFDQAARLGSRTKAGRTADQKLQNFTPVMTDNERGSLMLAWREAAGLGAFYLFLAWHDAGLNLFNLGVIRWIGVALGVVGGYLVVTATSSPQQRGIAARLGGHVSLDPIVSHDATEEEATELPIIPPTTRIILGVVGGVLLLVGAAMIFNAAFNLLMNPVPPTDIPSFEELYYGGWR
jgi:tetratricopeptide (TPR) repeat protein